MYAVISFICLGVIGGAIFGYACGRYQSKLLSTIRTLQERPVEPVVEKPGITMGEYIHESQILHKSDDRVIGITETKTPELLEWENQISIENRANGIEK